MHDYCTSNKKLLYISCLLEKGALAVLQHHDRILPGNRELITTSNSYID